MAMSEETGTLDLIDEIKKELKAAHLALRYIEGQVCDVADVEEVRGLVVAEAVSGALMLPKAWLECAMEMIEGWKTWEEKQEAPVTEPAEADGQGLDG